MCVIGRVDITEVQREINKLEDDLAEIRERMAGHLKELEIDV